MTRSEAGRPRWLRLVVVALAVHLLFCAQRVASKAVPGRLAEVAAWRQQGPVAFHFGAGSETAGTVAFLLANTPPDAVILRRGATRGWIEHAAALLAPRLLYDAGAVGSAATTVHGRPIARGRLPGGGEGVWVLVADDKVTLRLEVR